MLVATTGVDLRERREKEYLKSVMMVGRCASGCEESWRVGEVKVSKCGEAGFMHSRNSPF